MNKGFGLFLIITSSIFYGLLAPLLKKAQKVPPFSAMAISMFFLFLCSFLISLFFEKSINAKLIDNHKNEIVFLISVGVVNTLSFGLYLFAMKHLPLAQVALLNGFLTPFFASVFAFLIFREPLSTKFFLGFLITVFGLYVAVK